MVGPIAQAVALVCYGNEFLKTGNDYFDNANSTMLFCKEVKFCAAQSPNFIDRILRGKKEKIKIEIGSNINNWFVYLKDNGTKKLLLHYTKSDESKFSNRMTAGLIGGGGRWLIEAFNGNSSEFWEANWEVGDQDDPERKIWKVNYYRIAENHKPMIHQHNSMDGVKENLLEALGECNDFALQHDLDGFANCFKSATEALLNNDDNACYHKDLTPKKVQNDLCESILCACQLAWVFGGMGSWNDLWFEGEAQVHYSEISNKLYYLICDAIPKSTNSLYK